MTGEPGRSGPPPFDLSLGEVLDASEHLEIKRVRRGPQRLVFRSPSLEPLFWGLFSAGGFVSAILIPVNVAILGIAYGLGWLPDDALSYDRVLRLVHNPLTKLYLLALIALPLFHWAHRFRFAIHHQFGIGLKRLIALGCYGAALAGTALAVIVLIQI